MSIYQNIHDFIALAIKNGAIEEEDEVYLRNQLLHFLGLHDWEKVEATQSEDSLALMDSLLEIARDNGVIAEGGEEFYEAALMDFITPLPSLINRDFWAKYESSPEAATDYFYALTEQVNQVKTRAIAQNIAYKHATPYGELEITINLSKPEKDPKAIAAAKLVKQSSYPACALCMENEGYFGQGNKAARSNHRIVRLELGGEPYGFQYSPYAYYNEHSIVLNQKHEPMKIDGRAFENLLNFLELFPHYMIGSNADLPIVGGSILTHDHYQAGRHDFPMAKAGLRQSFELPAFPAVKAGIVDWAMSVIRLTSSDKDELLAASKLILDKWRSYSDPEHELIAQEADGTPHHTITPIARKRGDAYELDLVLRDNNVSEEHPDGIFHPHKDKHHIKKENIGLIEVMGLAILPPRLKSELVEVEKYVLGEENQIADMHRSWADEIKKSENIISENVEFLVRAAVGEVFKGVLQDAAVFKETADGQAAFGAFLDFLKA